MVSHTYSFTRLQNDICGFLRTQTAETDAFNAISSWKCLKNGRSYNILLEEDGLLNAEIFCYDDDIDAGKELDQQCYAYCVERTLII